MLLDAWLGMIMMSVVRLKNKFCCNENNINESPGWIGFDWSSECEFGGDGHPGLKEIVGFHVY